MSREVVHVSEAEAAANFSGVLARIRTGADVVIENDHRAVAVLSPAGVEKANESAAGVQGNESEEMRWLTSHTSELDQYVGEFVLIVASQVTAHSKDIEVIKKTVEDNGIRSPFVHYVAALEEGEFLPSNW